MVENSKFYVGGTEITRKEKDDILCGNKDKLIRCPDKQPGICLCWLTEHIALRNGKLDEDDPILIQALKSIDLPLEKTFIVMNYPPKDADPLTRAKRAAIFGYW